MRLYPRLDLLLLLGTSLGSLLVASCSSAPSNGAGGAAAGSSSAASSSSSSAAQSSSAASSSQSSSSSSSGSGGGAAGPQVIDITTDPNGLYWDATEATLYLADDTKNQLLKWTDKDGFAVVADLPPEANMSGPGNGQLVRLKDGTFVIPRFGFGTNGDVIVVHPDLTSDIIPNLDPVRRRVGLGLAPDGTLYIGGFVKVGAAQQGFVSVLDLSGTETDIAIMGLQKVVGVIVANGSLYVSDQAKQLILKSDLKTPDQASTYNTLGIAPVDLLSAGPNGVIYSGGTLGQIYQVSSTGTLTVFYGGLQQVRGTAYDDAKKRLFAIDHGSSPGKNHLVIVPVSP